MKKSEHVSLINSDAQGGNDVYTERRALLAARDAIASINEQFLEALSESARSDAISFPFSTSLRLRVSALTLSERQHAAQCGVLLVDAGFSDSTRWAQALSNDPGQAAAPIEEPWLTRHSETSLAYSTLLAAWHLMLASREVAGVLLGMTSDTAAALAQLGFRGLARIAQQQPHWIRPRWEGNESIWSNLLDLASTTTTQCMTIRCLMLSAGHSPSLDSYFNARP